MGNVLEQNCCYESREQDTSVNSILKNNFNEKLFSIDSDCEEGCLVECQCSSKNQYSNNKSNKPNGNRPPRYDLSGGALKESVNDDSKRLQQSPNQMFTSSPSGSEKLKNQKKDKLVLNNNDLNASLPAFPGSDIENSQDLKTQWAIYENRVSSKYYQQDAQSTQQIKDDHNKSLSKSNKRLYDNKQKQFRSSENNSFMLRQPSSQYTGNGYVNDTSKSFMDSSLNKADNSSSIHSENGNVYRQVQNIDMLSSDDGYGNQSSYILNTSYKQLKIIQENQEENKE